MSAPGCSSPRPARTSSRRRAPRASAPSCPTTGSPRTSTHSQGGPAPPGVGLTLAYAKCPALPKHGEDPMEPEELIDDGLDFVDEDFEAEDWDEEALGLDETELDADSLAREIGVRPQ